MGSASGCTGACSASNKYLITIGVFSSLMPRTHAQQVHHRTCTEQQREEQQHPGKIRCIEVEEPQKAHSHVLVQIPPHVNHHESQRRTQEVHIEERRHHRHQGCS